MNGRNVKWRTDAGAIQSKIVSPNLTQVFPAGGAVLTPISSGVAEDALAAWVEVATARVYLSFRRDDGTVQTVYSIDGGHTYTP